jgi:5-methylcytosine-specific restriction endonuclease McrA
MHCTDLTGLTDDALVSRLSTLCAEGHVLTARLIVHLIEVEDRRLDLRAACTSMFDFCQRRLGMSEGAAFRRITAARMVKRFPALLGRIERGELHLSTLVLIRPHLTEVNVEELAAAVAGKTQRQVEELLARLAPKPDVPSAIVELGAPSNDARVTLFAGSDARHVPSAPRARIEPLSEARYKVQLTASAELKAKLERASDLMRHRNPSGDLAVVIDAAMNLLLAKLEKERLGKATAPREPTKPRARSGTHRSRAIPAGVRRAVFERDGEQCTFIDEAGERCPQRGHLELDHVEARALGGTNAASNLRVRCRAHNRLAAEEVFGKAHVAERIDFRQRKSRAAAATPPSPSPSPSPLSPLSPPPSLPPPRAIELAVRGLHNMGFSKSDARRAVDHVSQRRVANGDELDVQDLLRGAIAALT